ncbi:uncharacterized protein B0H18DRAFT_546940 [Fomitopsis serialis]|uniref:uncharacterized protein n=1 Tax=Fomitopsis serialis TaxID=139415 RepID=UPI002007668D|nr:uncharacterized protein B0H18DRAFT_546940 [Neoantrodia serialis]KAH9934193.1 hypothetical protein B0H18DRAFT_546940 [Neoantrodia serialis]
MLLTMMHAAAVFITCSAWFLLCNGFQDHRHGHGFTPLCGIRDLLMETIPTCAATCWEGANYGNCSMHIPDATCLCSDLTFAESLYECIGANCSAEDADEYTKIAGDACDSVVSAAGIASTAHPADPILQGMNITIPSFIVQARLD